MKEYRLKINGEIDFIIISPQVLSSLISQIHNSLECEVAVNIEDIMPPGFTDYLLRVINGKRCGFSKRYFLVLVACRHLTCTKTECRKMFLSLIAPLTTIRLNRGKRSNRLPYIFAQGQER